MGRDAPIPHVLQVIRAELVTGLLYTWVVGPRYSREHEVKDVVAYHMIGFEGLAAKSKRNLPSAAGSPFARFLHDVP